MAALVSVSHHTTDNTVQDEPTWSISTSRGFPTSEKTGDNTEYRPEHEDLIFVLFIAELQEHRRQELSKNWEIVSPTLAIVVP